MSMSVAPSPSSCRGEIIIQPAYFTSSSFVHAARADIDRLIQEYSQQYTQSAPSRDHPFALFKEIWDSQGWTWIQFMVFDARSRAAFFGVVMRLFSERIRAGETPLDRVAALFGLYTVFSTQPSASGPPLYAAARVQITCDLYEEMLLLPDALNGALLLPIRPHVLYVQSGLLKAQVFEILPRAEMHPLNPRELPRECLVEDIEGTTARKKKGRPSKREKTKQARDSLAALDRWLEGESSAAVELRTNGEGSQARPPGATRDRYVSEKFALLSAIGGDDGYGAGLGRAREAVGERVQVLGAG